MCVCSGRSTSSYAIADAAVGRKGRQLVANNRSVVAEGSATPPVGVVSSVQLDPDTVDRAITGLLAVAGKVRDISQLVCRCVCVCVCVCVTSLFMDYSEVVYLLLLLLLLLQSHLLHGIVCDLLLVHHH